MEVTSPTQTSSNRKHPNSYFPCTKFPQPTVKYYKGTLDTPNLTWLRHLALLPTDMLETSLINIINNNNHSNLQPLLKMLLKILFQSTGRFQEILIVHRVLSIHQIILSYLLFFLPQVRRKITRTPIISSKCQRTDPCFKSADKSLHRLPLHPKTQPYILRLLGIWVQAFETPCARPSRYPRLYQVHVIPA